MRRDDPKKPEFASWDSYRVFAERVRHRRRYIFTKEVSAFLRTVLATNRDRDVDIPEGAGLFRAQRGIDWVTITDDDGNTVGEEPAGYGSERMKPGATDRPRGGPIRQASPFSISGRPRRRSFPRSGHGSGRRFPSPASASPAP